MTKQWAARKTKERFKEKIKVLEEIHNACLELGLTDEEASKIIQVCDENSCNDYGVHDIDIFSLLLDFNKIDDRFKIKDKLNPFLSKLNSISGSLDRYIDSEPMEFDGDIIITDPCYVSLDSDWPAFWGSPMLYKCIMRDTIYGDWGCTTFDKNSNKIYGKFCADAGLVGVFDRAEVADYNPNFEKDYGDRQWCWTLIENFKGKCWFKVKQVRFKWENQWHMDYEVEVHGSGINKITGEPIEFVGEQTSL